MDSGGETVELNGQAEGAEPAAERVGPGSGAGEGSGGSAQGLAGGSVPSARHKGRPSRFFNPSPPARPLLGVGVPLPASHFVLIQRQASKRLSESF